MQETKIILDFLEKLQKNNQREWFNDHKAEYREVHDQFIELTASFIREIYTFDPGIGAVHPKDCIFRLYRDIRFSKNKSPYKTHFGAYIAPGGRKSEKAGYYLHIEPGATMAAGGMYRPGPDVLKAIRREIYFNLDEYKAIIEAPGFLKTFGGLMEEDKLSRPPKGYSKDFEGIEHLKHKSFAVMHGISDKVVRSKEFMAKTLETYQQLLPLNAFLNRAVEMMEGQEG